MNSKNVSGVAIIADSACDISAQLAADLQVTVVPLHVVFSKKEYLDGVDLTPEEFYQKIVSTKEIPGTSQPAPADFLRAFQDKLANHRDVICLTISSKLSGTYQSALIAQGMLPLEQQKYVHIFDTCTLCIAELILVRVAAQMALEGRNADIILNALESLKGRLRLLAMFDTLDYLRKGGRIPAGIALGAGLLHIKPVITVEKGKIAIIGIAKGSKNGKSMIRKAVHKHGGVDYTQPIQFGYTGLTDDTLRKYIADNEDLYGTYSSETPIACVGPTIGTHVGPGAIACAFVSNK